MRGSSSSSERVGVSALGYRECTLLGESIRAGAGQQAQGMTLGDEICHKTGLFQLYNQPNPDSASAAFLILSYQCPSTDEQMGLISHLMESGVEKSENSMKITSRALRVW